MRCYKNVCYLLLELYCIRSLLLTLDSDMRRTQRRVLLCVTSLRSRRPTLLLRHPVLPRNLATQGSAKRGEGRGGKTRQRCATVAQSRSLKFLNFNNSRMGRLRHNMNFILRGMLSDTALWTGLNSFKMWSCSGRRGSESQGYTGNRDRAPWS
jgi:hypothetical protein